MRSPASPRTRSPRTRASSTTSTSTRCPWWRLRWRPRTSSGWRSRTTSSRTSKRCRTSSPTCRTPKYRPEPGTPPSAVCHPVRRRYREPGAPRTQEERFTVRADQPRVVVTGLGATTPLGGDVASTWESLLAGRSGARTLPDEWAAELPVHFAAPAAVDPTTVIDRVQARRMDRCEQLALVAAREAWADAGAPTVEPERLGVVVSSGIGGIASTLVAYDTLRDKGWQRLSPYTVPMLMPNGSAGWIGIELNARAGVHTTVSACASGAEAIGYAIEMIRSGRADVVLAGGTEAAILPLNIAAFAAMRALSTRNDEPQRASRPFDKGRDGFLLGEGAGMVVVESAEHAARRDATGYAIAAGAG